MVGRNKNLVWIPTKKKQIGVISEMPIADIPNSGNDADLTSASVREEFSFFLSECVKSSRNTNNIFGTLGDTAVQSYLSMLDKRDDGSIELFDYNQLKWSHIQDIYQIVNPKEVEKIFSDLLGDPAFIQRDKEHNQGWRPGALNLYILFLRARKYFSKTVTSNRVLALNTIGNVSYRPYITAIKSKPFLLLAGISGTGKSRIVRELARACWDEGSEEYEAQKPKNFEMVQVKPNWHDSSELIGYVSRVSGSPVFEAGDFLKFVAKAWENPEVPYFLCLDEMNLAPVEQYFAEYLSVVESRKADGNGVITTDPILKKCDEQWYFDLTAKLTNDDEIRARFNKDGICIPQNLIVVGTVNMDETTFSFSRKVLDRAMTIEMNEVDLYGGLTDRHEKIGKLEAGNLIGTAVEGVDVYKNNKDVCEKVINYLKVINANLEGTPFKVAYRTRNEFLLYVVNNLLYNKEEDGSEISQKEIIARALDEITSMKILSRIEGDETKIGNLLEQLREIISGQLKTISDIEYSATKNEEGKAYSISLAKLKEMEKRLKTSGYTSFWS
ncbi:MAG: AAA family ATPase [Prevotella sp.]|nr:AAA family ATPase [Prevotella sp.]